MQDEKVRVEVQVRGDGKSWGTLHSFSPTLTGPRAEGKSNRPRKERKQGNGGLLP